MTMHRDETARAATKKLVKPIENLYSIISLEDSSRGGVMRWFCIVGVSMWISQIEKKKNAKK